MKIHTKKRIISLILTVVMVILVGAPNVSVAAFESVNVGAISDFAVLAGSAITNTGPTVINGDVGLFPGTAYTSANATVNGVINITDAIAVTAQDELTTAYNAAAGMSDVKNIASELGETTLTPGTYDSSDGTFQITGTLTLDAQGDADAVFIFKTASTLIAASGSNVKLINGANSCQVFWVVGSSATLGTNSNFVGTILALTSITANNGASIQGRLLARNGAVTLENNEINANICVIAPYDEPIEKPEEEEEQQEEEEEEVPVIETPETPVAPEKPETPEVPETPVEVAPVVDAVVVEAVPSVPVTTTVTGGKLPKTGTDLNNMFLIGAALILVGALGLRYRKSHE